MKLEKLKFKSPIKNFYIEATPDNLGFRFVQSEKYKNNECVAMIIDNGENFLLASKGEPGMRICSFIPTKTLLLKDGSKAPIEEDQMEIITPYKKKMVARPLSKDNPESGVIIAYEKNNTMMLIAICGAPIDGILIRLSQ